MSRGLGQLEHGVVMCLGLRVRRPALVTDIASDLAHERRSLRFPDRGYSESCDCAGPCLVVTDALLSSVRRAVSRLEEREVVTAHLDALGRKVVSLSTWPPAWRFGVEPGPEPVNPRLCPDCGLRLAGKAVRGES